MTAVRMNTLAEIPADLCLIHFPSITVDHIHLVARPLAEIVQLFDIAELHVSLTHGLWRHDQWGYPPVDAAMGAEVYAWFVDTDHASKRLTDALVDAQWKRLVDTLSGLLCASLTFVDASNTLRPQFSFRPQFSNGALPTASANEPAAGRRFVRYATLPREIVCTENLTPWKKLLPCRQRQAGLVSLLNSGHIHSTNYHSLGLHLRTLQTASDAPRRLELKQTANLVYDKALISPNDDWSMRKMFGQGLAGGSCYLAASSYVYVDVTEPNDEYVITPAADRVVLSQRGGSLTKLAEYDLKNWPAGGMFHLAANKPRPIGRDQPPPTVALYPTPPIHLRRFLLGAGQERGQISTRITNTHWAALPVLLHENLPWFVPAYLHTLRVRDERTGATIQPAAVHYVPGLRRTRAGQLELAFTVPARCTVTVTLDIDYIHLKWLEYPPDANHGHYIGAATLTVQLPVARNYTAVPLDGFLLRDAFNASRAGGYVVQLRSESLLITLPTPDFSMPYNVICLACTVVALAFGPLHNMATKRIALVEDEDGDADGEAKPTGLWGRLRAKVWPAKRKTKSE